ncbi:MAG TPA: 2-dehydropantoate 2-reductase [Clostridiaceae bacterium]|nr:2-dehydropantoate 2-reductase [Clostridiaceae bacterium]
MKYLIVGTGGIGGSVGGFLAAAGLDVSFIAHGRTLDALKKNGLTVNSYLKGSLHIKNVKAYSPEEYELEADVVFVCVKDYSLDSVIPFLKKACGSGSIVIPLLNGFGAGDRIRAELAHIRVADGCVYVSAFIDSPGSITQIGSLFKMIFGFKEGSGLDSSLLEEVKADLKGCGIDANVSDRIEMEIFRKFSFVSAAAACGSYYGVTIGEIQHEGVYRDTFLGLCKEIEEIAGKLGFNFNQDLISLNLNILDKLAPDTTSSLQKDLKAGKQSEIDSLIFSVVRLADRLGAEAPLYRMIAKKSKSDIFLAGR